MAKKISALLLCAVMLFSIFALSSCYLLNEDVVGGLLSDSNGDSNITVEGGDTNNITINGAESGEAMAASKALLSSVSIFCEFSGKRLNGPNSEKYYSSGSGVIYKLDKTQGEAYIITNYHVVHDEQSATYNKISSKIRVALYGQDCRCEDCLTKNSEYWMSAVYVGGSAQYDVAVLKISTNTHLMTSSAAAASFANSNAVSVLEKVIAIGNPGGNGISSTVGFVNVDSEIIDLDGDGLREFRVIRTDAAVNSGNSGGGLFNLKGEVVGIVNAKMADDSVDNIGYAIPSNIAKAVSDNIIYYCDGTQVEHPKKILIGITLSHNNKIRSEYNTETGTVSIVETVAVEEVAVGSAAHKLIYAGDVINSITIDGIKYEITRSFQVVDSMINARATSKISINVTRDGKTLDVEIPVDASRLKDWE